MKSTALIAGLLLLVFAINPVGAQGVTATLGSGAAGAATNSLGAVDNQRSVTLTGTVKYVRLVGERSRIQLLVTDQQGHVQEWSLEGPAHGGFVSAGLRTRKIQQFDKISVVIHPLKDNSTGGETLTVVPAS